MAAALALVALGVLAQTEPRPARAALAQGDEAALAEALKRLEKTLSRHGSKVSAGVIRRFDAKDFRGCKITYELTPQLAPDHKGYVPFTERTVIDLSTLDPARVEARGGDKGASVGFVTRDGRPAIERRVAREPHAFGDATWLGASHISLTNRAAAEEARAWLARAAELCAR
jgi:hypothetical protein